MKKLFAIEDTLENKISFYHIAVFLATLPFDRLYSELALISFTIHTLIHITRQKLRSVFTFRILILSSIFFIALTGILYSQDKDQGLKDLQRQLAILLFPLCLCSCGLDLSRYKMKLLLIFSFTCVLTIFYLYFDALRIITYNKLPFSDLFTQAFINHNFTEPIALHATYLGMYSLLSLAVLLFCLLKEKNIFNRLLTSLAILILSAGLLQLASKAVLISAVVIAAIIPFIMIQGKRRIAFIGVSLVISLFVTLFILNTETLKTRYISGLRNDLANNTTNGGIPEPRAIRWRLALELVKRSPLCGYGSGSEKRLLNEAWFTNKLYVSYLSELNAHNQYISLLLKTGSWGLLIFLLTIITAFAAAFREKSVLFTSFLVIISTVSCSENILDVNKGIFFYSFFLSLFALSGKPFAQLFRFHRRQGSHDHSRPENKTRYATTVRSDNNV